MIGYCSPTGLSFRVCVYFARNPDEELTTTDIEHKFGAARKYSTNGHLHSAVTNRLLAVRKVLGLKGSKVNCYSAGPALLELIGERRAQET